MATTATTGRNPLPRASTALTARKVSRFMPPHHVIGFRGPFQCFAACGTRGGWGAFIVMADRVKCARCRRIAGILAESMNRLAGAVQP